MTDPNWRYGTEVTNGTSNVSAGRCPKHNLPLDEIPTPPPTLTKASSFHNCESYYESHLPSNLHHCDSDSSARGAPSQNERALSVDLPHRPASAEPHSNGVEVCDDTTQCNSTNNGEVLTRPERARIRKRFRRRKPFCLRATLANFSIFCRQTSLHGWQYIAQRNSSSAKHMFWAVVVSLSMATAAMFLYNNTMDYLNATVVTTVDTMTVPLSEVFFPSVVVCNINQVRKSFFEELGIYDNETFIRQIYYDYIEGKSSNTLHDPHSSNDDDTKIAIHDKILKEYLEKKNETVKSINWLTAQKCKDMFILSKWNGKTLYDFQIPRDFGTDYGICCWHTPQMNLTEVYQHQIDHNLTEPHWGEFFTNVQKGAKTGKDNGYTMLFDIESFDYSYYDEGSEGLKVALVHHLDMPIMRQTGFHIAPGTENQIAVTPTLIVTSPSAMQRFSPAERDCYSEDEISLKYLPRDHGFRYEMSNCLFESAFENILHKCKCFPGFHTLAGDHGEEGHHDLGVCLGPNLTCMNDMMNRMGQFDHVEYKGQQVKCRSNCEDQINSLFVTTSSYPNRKTLIYREEFCILAKNLLEKCKGPKRKPLEREYPNLCSILHPLTQLDQDKFCKNNAWDIPRKSLPNCNNRKCPMEDAILEYARENLVMFNIFIKDPYAKRFQKDEKITKTSYIANSGGLLGLCMGFSLISAAEILYHCFFGIYSAIFPSEKKKQRLRARKSDAQHYCQHAKTSFYDSASGSAVQDWTDLSQFQQQQQLREIPQPHHHSSQHPHHYQCCNFQHIVQLQDGGTAQNVVLCSNTTTPRLRNVNKHGGGGNVNKHKTTCQKTLMGNGSCVSATQQLPITESSNTTIGHTGPERII